MWLINYQLKYIPQLSTASRDFGTTIKFLRLDGRRILWLIACGTEVALNKAGFLPSFPLFSPGGGGATPGNSWWGCAARSFKSWPYLWPKNIIFHTRFQTRPEIMLSVFTLERKQKNPSNPFRTRISLFLSYSFEIETINTFIHSRSSLKNHTRFQTKIDKVYTSFQTKTAQTSYPMGMGMGMGRHMPI